MKKLFPLFILAVSCSSLAADPVTVLGVPLGGRLVKPPKNCPLDSSKSKEICWVDSPHLHKDGSRSGYAHFPAPETRAKWAAYAMFKIDIAKDLTLGQVVVKPFPPNTQGEIENSITARFGYPTSRTSHTSASWDLPTIDINLLCASKTECWVTFKSPEYSKVLRTELEARRKLDQARPTTP